jgi:hypothetical protein
LTAIFNNHYNHRVVLEQKKIILKNPNIFSSSMDQLEHRISRLERIIGESECKKYFLNLKQFLSIDSTVFVKITHLLVQLSTQIVLGENETLIELYSNIEKEFEQLLKTKPSLYEHIEKCKKKKNSSHFVATAPNPVFLVRLLRKLENDVAFNDS